MIMQIVALRDIKTNLFSQPQFIMSIEGWRRAIGDAIQDKKEPYDWVRHPEDFEAWHMGQYDDNTGEFTEPKDGERNIHKGEYIQLFALDALK